MLVGVVDVAGESGAVVVRSARGIGHEVLAPRIDDMSPGVCETVRHEDVELPRARLPTEHAGVDAALWTERRFDLRVMERSLFEIERAPLVVGEGADRVMRVGRVEAVEHEFTDVGLVVAVGVFEEQQVRLLRDEHAASAEFETGRHMQSVGEDGPLVGAAVAVGVFKDQNLVARHLAGEVLRVGLHRADPEPALGVERHLHRVGKFRKVLLRRKKVDRVTVGQLELLGLFVRRGQDDRVLVVRRNLGERLGVDRLGERRRLFALRDGPNPGVAGCNHLAELGELGREIDDAERCFASAVDVVTVDGAIVVEELEVLFVDFGFELGEIGRRRLRLFAEQYAIEQAADDAVAVRSKMSTVNGQARAQMARIDRTICGCKEVDKRHSVLGGNAAYRFGVKLDVRVRFICGSCNDIECFDRDRRHQHNLPQVWQLRAIVFLILRRRAIERAPCRSKIIDHRRVFEEPFEIGFEARQSFRAGERFVEAEEREDHVRLMRGERVAVIGEVF